MTRTATPAGVTAALECGHPLSAAERAGDFVDCPLCDQRQIPATTTLGRRTPTFDADTVSKALLSAHRTNAWAELIVTAGSVEFHEGEDTWTCIAGPGASMVIVPQRHHRITPGPDSEFHVQFHDLPSVRQGG